MALFGASDGGQGRPDASMKEVLDATEALGLTPPWTLTPQEARLQPTPADGAEAVMRRRGLDPDDDMGVETEEIEIPGPAGPIQARIYRTRGDTEPRPVVVYFHGGGWVIADLDVYDPSPRALAKATGCVFVSCHYRHAPENKFPAAHEDAWAAWQWVTGNAAALGGDGERFAIVGESAGGNLAANVTLRARNEGGVLPSAQILVYPIAGGDTNTASYVENADAKPLNKPFMEWFFHHYLNDASELADPRIDLRRNDLAGLPPTTIINAEIDPLRTEGRQLAEAMEAAGVEVDHHCYDGVAHEFFGMGLVVKDAAAAQTRVTQALNKGLRHGIMGKIADALS
jgi:acetyl esterase/lipase